MVAVFFIQCVQRRLSEAEDAIKTGDEWKSLDDLKKALEV